MPPSRPNLKSYQNSLKTPPLPPIDQIIDNLRRIANSNGKDRVAANARLYEILSQKGETSAPLTPNDDASIILALTRILTAAGPDLARRAWSAAFPSEAPLAAEIRPGLPPS